jgi:flagellar biosynthesis/type III secretory pathway M-ring protein FliF/YscJ
VEWKEIVFGAVLVGVLIVLAAFYAWRQVLMLRRLRGPHGLSDEEARWRRGQAWRRLAGSALMLVMAGLLAWAVLGMGNQAQQLADAGPAADTPEAHQFFRVYFLVWAAFLLLLVALIFLVAADIWSTRRFSTRAQRKILDDKKAMLQREVARMRGERNGHG